MSDSPKRTEEIAGLSFEEALEQLEEIVDKLEKGDVPLEASIATYERGERLKRHCAELLKRAEKRIEKIRLNSDGKAESVESLDADNE